jgi:hypothetical protein
MLKGACGNITEGNVKGKYYPFLLLSLFVYKKKLPLYIYVFI